MPKIVLLLALAGCSVAIAGCSRSSAPSTGAAPSASATGERPRYGAVMSETGRRFELAGRAFAAGRFELATFEVEELVELFEEDLPRAEPPKEGNAAALPGLAKSFLETHAPALRKAADARDRAAFADAFKRAAAACNECHRASEHGFIEVPSALGASVPSLEPAPASSR